VLIFIGEPSPPAMPKLLYLAPAPFISSIDRARSGEVHCAQDAARHSIERRAASLPNDAQHLGRNVPRMPSWGSNPGGKKSGGSLQGSPSIVDKLETLFFGKSRLEPAQAEF